MNVSLQKLFLGLLFILAVPLLGEGQDVELQTFRDTPVDYVFSSYPYNPSLSGRPDNGTVEITDLGQNNYRLTYQPDPDFVGEDMIRLFVWVGTTWEPRRVFITVSPSEVIANPDLAFTYQNTSVDIDVLVNDEASSGFLTIKSIMLVNNGEAVLTAGEDAVTFTPAPDFEGVAQLNYVVCDEYDTCDQGTVSVTVVNQETTSDTIRVFTKKNKPQVLFIPREFPLTVQPSNGIFSSESELPTYVPNTDFIGVDYMEFADGAMVKVVEITVLDVEDNSFAFDDDIYTTSYNSVEFNVLDNDFYRESSGCLTASQPQFGQVELNTYPNGSITYTPPAGFQGVDKFTYTAMPPDCDGEPEEATVYVYVSNFEPAYSKFKMVTPKLTPLIIGYDIPVRNFDFAITAQAELGEALFLDGRVDTTIYGQRVKGYNLIIYTPGEDITSGTDEFEIEYCVVQAGDCQFKKIVKIEIDILDIGAGNEPMCFDDCIWPGDTNLDGIVNMQDLMPLGSYMGAVGVPRENANLGLWYGQYGDDWGSPVDGMIDDLKHADTDGNSLVTGADTTAISLFYGYTHSLAPAPVPDFKHILELRGDVFVEPGDLIELDMLLGSEEDPAVDVYGFTFPFEYNPDFFVPESVEADFESNSWFSYGSPILYMSHNDKAGALEGGITRTNQESVTGYGKLGQMRIIVSDDIAGFRPDDEEVLVDIGGGVATLTNASGQTFGVKVESLTIHINLRGDKDEEVLRDPVVADRLLKVYPNPTTDFLNLHLNGGHEFQRVIIHNLAGQQVFDSGTMAAQRNRINVSRLVNGIYILSVQTTEGVIRKKFEIIR